jgi:hypothetical protein
MPHLSESVREANRTAISWSTYRNLLRLLPQVLTGVSNVFASWIRTEIVLQGLAKIAAWAPPSPPAVRTLLPLPRSGRMPVETEGIDASASLSPL